MVFCEVTFCDRTAVNVTGHFRGCNLGDGWWCRQAATVPQGDQEVEGGLDGEEGEAGGQGGRLGGAGGPEDLPLLVVRHGEIGTILDNIL